MSKPVTVIAGCGYVGSALAIRLLEAGHTVYGLRRNVAALPEGVKGISVNLSDGGTVSLPHQIDNVVYCAAADGHDAKAYRSAYVTGLSNVLAAVQERGATPRRVLFTSSTSVYHQDDGSWVDEDSPTEPTNFTGKTLLEAEQILFDSPFSGVVVRLSGIYGPGRRRTIDTVRDGKAVCTPPPPQYLNHIHRDDCAGALHHLLDLAGPDDLYIATDSDPADKNEIVRWLAGELGVPAPGEGEPGTGRSKRYSGNKRCRNARLIHSGYKMIYPTYKEGYFSLLRESAY